MSARSRRCCIGAGSLPKAATFCSTISFARTAASTKMSLPTPTATETSAPWWSTTTATAQRTAPSTFPRPMPTRDPANFASGACEGLGLTGRSSVILAFRDSLTGPGISAPRLRSCRPRPHPRSACLSVSCLSQLARTARHRGAALGPALRPATEAAASPISTMRSSIWNCGPCTMLCAGSSIRPLCAFSPTPPSARPLSRNRRRSKLAAQTLSSTAAWKAGRAAFLRAAQSSYRATSDQARQRISPTHASMDARFRVPLRAAMRIPAMEASSLLPGRCRTPCAAQPQSAVHRHCHVGTGLAWCVLELLAESIDARIRRACGARSV